MHSGSPNRVKSGVAGMLLKKPISGLQSGSQFELNLN